MKKMRFFEGAALLAAAALAGCERLDDDITKHGGGDPPFAALVSPAEVAELLAALPIETAQVQEVFDAVSSSSGNGYDEEYMMRDLLAAPGSGVGGAADGTKSGDYAQPMRDLITAYISDKYRTKAGEADTSVVNSCLRALSASGMQIYWPYSEDWDGRTLPVITFDPDNGSETNEGYVLGSDEKVLVDEAMARERPVWVVNTNDDSAYKTLEVLRREDPDWGAGGGIGVRSGEEKEFSTLYLKTFKAKRNYDPWFAGASEFFIKCGSVEGFKATKEEDMALYSPTISDFMIVMKRRDVGFEIGYKVVLVSEWTEQLENCAFIIVEDDGGTRTSWKCAATVKFSPQKTSTPKTYGFDIDIPIHTKDDIVWRGQLSRSYVEKYSGKTGHFGDVDVVLELE